MYFDSNDHPRSIIRKTQLSLSTECISMLKKDSMRQLIQRTRNRECLLNAKHLSQLEIPKELTFTYNLANNYFALVILIKMTKIES